MIVVEELVNHELAKSACQGSNTFFRVDTDSVILYEEMKWGNSQKTMRKEID